MQVSQPTEKQQESESCHRQEKEPVSNQADRLVSSGKVVLVYKVDHGEKRQRYDQSGNDQALHSVKQDPNNRQRQAKACAIEHKWIHAVAEIIGRKIPDLSGRVMLGVKKEEYAYKACGDSECKPHIQRVPRFDQRTYFLTVVLDNLNPFLTGQAGNPKFQMRRQAPKASSNVTKAFEFVNRLLV